MNPDWNTTKIYPGESDQNSFLNMFSFKRIY